MSSSVQPAGSSPRQATSFLCFAKERRQRKATPMPAPLACGEGFPAVREERAQAQNSLRSLRSLRSDSCAKSVHEARCARGLALLCSSAWHRGKSKQPNSQQPNTEQPRLTRSRRFPAVGCSAAAPMRCREAQPAWAACVSTRLPSDSARLSERSERSERSEFRAGPSGRASQGTPWRSQGAAHRGRVLCFLSCTSKKGSRLPGRNPGGVFRSAQIQSR